MGYTISNVSCLDLYFIQIMLYPNFFFSIDQYFVNWTHWFMVTVFINYRLNSNVGLWMNLFDLLCYWNVTYTHFASANKPTILYVVKKKYMEKWSDTIPYYNILDIPPVVRFIFLLLNIKGMKKLSFFPIKCNSLFKKSKISSLKCFTNMR